VKRLIEEDFPIFEVGQASAEEKGVPEGYISTLHIWWARRPLAACRAAIFASLVPDPGTLTEQIPEYVDFLLETLPEAPNEKENEWLNMRARKRLVKFTADISPWEASTNQKLLDKARKIIEVGTAVIKGLRRKELKEVIKGKHKVEMPKVLDPFAGGGSIPLEALRLGCQAYAVEYNPVAVLILKATLEYPQKDGEKLVKYVEKWGNWVLDEAKKEIGQFYPEEGDPNGKPLFCKEKKGGWIPVGYIWARTIQCQNPSCGAEIPLIRSFWLRKSDDLSGKIDWSDSIYLRPIVDRESKRVEFEIVDRLQINGFDPNKGTRPTGSARATFCCPLCNTTYKADELRKYGRKQGFGRRMICVVLSSLSMSKKRYWAVTDHDR
jgi:adenine-specific DNA methylase